MGKDYIGVGQQEVSKNEAASYMTPRQADTTDRTPCGIIFSSHHDTLRIM